MKYLCLIVGSEGAGPAPGSAEFGQMLAEYGAVVQEMREAGILVDGGPLRDESTATTLRVRDGESMITDGPFAEIKEQLWGYFALECSDLDEVLSWVAKIPTARYGAIEVRPVMEVSR